MDDYPMTIKPKKKFKRFDYYRIMPKWMTDNSPVGGSYNYAYYLIHPWRLLSDWYYQVKWFVQRGYRGYADCDTWSLDCYLSKWMPKAIRTLTKRDFGHPCGMTARGWHTRLERMADGFEAAREIQELKHEHRSRGERAAWRRFSLGMRLFHEHFFSLWD